MSRRRLSAAALPLLAIAMPVAAQQALPADQAALRAHVAFLADDRLKGREAGTPEHVEAARYVADRMRELGLEPAGIDGHWFQPVPLVTAVAEDASTLALNVDGRRVPLVLNTDWTGRAEARARVDLDAGVVFAGYGVVDAGSGRDDYAGLDVRGKVVAVLYGGPADLPSEPRAHFGSRSVKAEEAARHGAAGILFVESSAIHQVFPFQAMTAYWGRPGMTWAHGDGSAELPPIPTVGVLSFAGAAKLFTGSRIGWDAVLAADKAGTAVPRGPLAAHVEARLRTTLGTATSPNVVGMLRGSDPALANEFVVLSAHLDHIGVGRPDARGDTINNGALDNAIGTGAMLEAAKLLAAGPRPKRSILFVAVTAEEKGLIGSDYFAQHPTVPRGSIVADVNLDMPILTYDFVDLVALGADRSSIGPIVAAAAKAQGLALVPDPAPEEGNFTRTDHYSFVRQGIPSVSLDIGPGGPGKAATEDFLANHYHQPSDDLSLPIDWRAGTRFVALNAAIARGIADAPARPVWNRGDFFGALYGGPMAK